MAIEIRQDISRRDSRRLRNSPEVVFANDEGTREFRVVGVHKGEPPYSRNLLVRRFDYQEGKWRPSSEGGRFTHSERSMRSITMMAHVKGCTNRTV